MKYPYYAAILFGLFATAVFATPITVTGKAPVVDDVVAARAAALADARKTAVEKVLGVMVDSRVRVESALLVQDTVLARADGFISNETILEEGLSGDFYLVKISCDVRERDVAAELDKLKKSVVVRTVETYNGKSTGEAAVEGLVRMALVETGHKCLDPAYLAGSDAAAKLDAASALSEDEVRELGRRFLAQVLVYGTITVEDAGEVPEDIPYVDGKNPLAGLKKAVASFDLKAVDTDTDKVIAERQSVPGEIIGFGTDPDRAARDALAEAGDVLAGYFAGALADLNPNAEREVLIEIFGVTDFSTFDQLSRTVETTPGVVGLAGREYTGDAARLTVIYVGRVEDLGVSVDNLANPYIRVIKFTEDHITAELED
ncbi:MAG: hypothetical protein JSW52_11175 [Candidatus Coatesbacteria bacterium]|nr:MAG: hypothetical protein JSW52_11175 [Candidatus Coatesbacteria bacterium]